MSCFSLNRLAQFFDQRMKQAMELPRAAVLDLLKRVGNGDQAAFGELYRAYSRRIYAYALNLLRDAELAEKAAADSMFEIWRHPDRFDGSSQFSTWLIAVVRHKAFDAWRAKCGETEDIDDHEDELESTLPDGFTALAEKQRRERVRRCMDRLPPVQQECLHLAFYEDMALCDIAAVQICPENTVKTRLFHARRKIKRCLERLLEAENGNG